MQNALSPERVASSNNIEIGNAGVAAESNTIRIGTQGVQTDTFIAGIFGTPMIKKACEVVASEIGSRILRI